MRGLCGSRVAASAPAGLKITAAVTTRMAAITTGSLRIEPPSSDVVPAHALRLVIQDPS